MSGLTLLVLYRFIVFAFALGVGILCIAVAIHGQLDVALLQGMKSRRPMFYAQTFSHGAPAL